MKYEKELRALVEEQAKDRGIFFMAQTAPEAYLQQEIRKLHALVEENEIDIAICFGQITKQNPIIRKGD